MGSRVASKCPLRMWSRTVEVSMWSIRAASSTVRDSESGSCGCPFRFGIPFLSETSCQRAKACSAGKMPDLRMTWIAVCLLGQEDRDYSKQGGKRQKFHEERYALDRERKGEQHA